MLVIVVLGDDFDLVSNKVGRVETDTELTDHGDISARGESFHESLGTGFGDGTKVVDEIGLGHTNTAIADRQDVVFLVGDDANVEILLGFENGRVGQGLVANLVQGIRGVGDQLTQEDFLESQTISCQKRRSTKQNSVQFFLRYLVGVEGVDDQAHQLRDLSLEGEGFGLGSAHGKCSFGEEKKAVERKGAAARLLLYSPLDEKF